MIEIEFEIPERETCECCGNETIRLTRFVYQDNDAFAVYYAKFTENHKWIKDVFHITDHMVTDDKEVVRYFSG